MPAHRGSTQLTRCITNNENQTSKGDSSFDETQLEAEKLQDSLNQAMYERDCLTVDIFKEASRVANEFAVLSVDAIVLVRRELGLNTPESFETELRDNIVDTAHNIYNNAREWAEKMGHKYGANAVPLSQN